MKKILFSSIIFVLMLLASSCQDKLEDLYQNPDGFSKELADESGVSIYAGFFSSQLTRAFFLRGDYGAFYHQLRSGNRLVGSGIQMYNVSVDGGDEKVLKDVEHDWGTANFNGDIFNFVNGEWIKQVLWAQQEYNFEADENKNQLDSLFMYLLYAMKAHGYQRATDFYDVIPYIESGSSGGLEGEKAEYIGQQEVYPKILDELKRVDEFLINVNLSSSDMSLFKRQDVLYGGDLLKWRKYVNSLRLRCAMNLSEVQPETTRSVLSEISQEPLFDQYNDDAGIADVQIVNPALIQVELGITRVFRERYDDSRASNRFLDSIMDCKPIEKTVNINGIDYTYFESDNSATGFLDGTVDPRVRYMYSTDLLGRYIGISYLWDDNTDPDSYYNKLVRAYYINDPIMTDLNVTSFTYGPNDEWEIVLNGDAVTDLSKRDEFLRGKIREKCTKYEDTEFMVGRDRNIMSEFNIIPQFNFDLRYPTIHAVEVELLLAEADIRGFGTINGSAREHYKRAIEMSCRYWYELNSRNKYSKSTTPAFPNMMDDSRIDRDRAQEEYDPAPYAEFKAQQFDALPSPEAKVKALFDQLQLHYNYLNWEVIWNNARRLIKYIGDNPATPFEVYRWKERMTYPADIQATDPEAWAIISPHDNPDLPLWFTGRKTKWENIMER